jgi:two-component system, chemotaxis family, chemotaxis protein CheY
MRLIVKNSLAKYGVTEIEEADSKAKALEIFQRFRPDITFLDLVMDDSGMDILKSIKEIDKNARVFMLTSVDQKSVSVEASNLGAEGIISKPDFQNELSKIMGANAK